DTGAFSHMTPHRNWFILYMPYVVPICLADDCVIHSEGVGTIVFRPDSGDWEVHFHDVLYVPMLRNNLLSPFHLICQ
ncbi:hypothetical protein L218DRAFT_815964, partial [Marasmius fiardii PR-910]